MKHNIGFFGLGLILECSQISPLVYQHGDHALARLTGVLVVE
jgi:hypothetical protein